MTEIDIERRRRFGGWSWALAVIVLLLVVGTTWYLAAGPGYEGGPRTDTDTLMDTRPAPQGTPPTDPRG